MKVECPHCQTIFKLTQAQIELADGMVRCGMCKEVFNALLNIEDPFADDDKETISPPVKQPENKISQAMDSGMATVAPDTAKAHKQPADESPRPKLGKEPATRKPAVETKDKLSEDLFENVQSKLIPDEFRIPELHKPYSVWHDASWSIAILFLTVTLFMQLAWFNRNNLVSDPQIKPWVMKLCDSVNCDDYDLRDPDQVEMVSRNIYSHPNLNNALMISATMVNHATFSQPYPNIQVAFSDVRGEVVASRVFTPDQYLQLHKNSIGLLASETPIDFGLEIQDPGPSAMTYEFDFL